MASAQNDIRHVSVLLSEVVSALSPGDGDVIVDGTFGFGGYSRAILGAASCSVFGIDRDAVAIARGRQMEEEFTGRLKVLEGCFADMADLLIDKGIGQVDGVALDLGVSSMQLDEAERGFSFQKDGPLDMRMSQSGMTAADVVNDTPETELADIIYTYGEERKSRRVAKFIAEARKEQPFNRTLQLAKVIERALGPQKVIRGKKQVHPATLTFQALRIYVNEELKQLSDGLVAAEKILKPGGRLAVVSFHSLEDRIVKRFLSERSGRVAGSSRHMPQVDEQAEAPTFTNVSKAIAPADEEVSINPRARSSKLRSAVRTDAPAWGGHS